MNSLIILSYFFVCCCLVNGSVQSNSSCAAAVSAYPPDPTSGCCGIDRAGNTFTGSSTTRLDEHPWLALIEYDKDGILKMLCGGALISGKYVLTAAHCITGLVLRVGKPKNIRLGDYDTRNDGPDCSKISNDEIDCTDGVTRIPIEKTIPHPDYEPINQRKWNDIALIRMEQIAPFTDFIRPICLPTIDVTLETDSLYLIKAGWGQISGLSPIKLQTELPFVSREKCQLAFSTSNRNTTLWKGQICAGAKKGKQSCKGDGGMPLMFQNGKIYEAVGVVSFGTHPCGIKNIPNIYTNIYEYKSWIISNIVD